MELGIEVQHILLIVAAVLGCGFVLKVIKGAVKWALFLIIVIAALVYFKVV